MVWVEKIACETMGFIIIAINYHAPLHMKEILSVFVFASAVHSSPRQGSTSLSLSLWHDKL